MSRFSRARRPETSSIIAAGCDCPAAAMDFTRETRPVAQTFAGLRTTRTLRGLADLLVRLRTLVARATGAASPLSRGMRRLQGLDRRLQVTETVQLGEKRFVAILRVDGEQFLLGGSATGVSLLATLVGAPPTTAAESVQVVSPADERVIAVETSAPVKSSSFSAVLAAQSCPGGLA